jgi:hypothetical protein
MYDFKNSCPLGKNNTCLSNDDIRETFKIARLSNKKLNKFERLFYYKKNPMTKKMLMLLYTDTYTEDDFLEHKDVKKVGRKILMDKFHPEASFTGEEWLSNVDIDDCLSQYEKQIPDYKHFGTYMYGALDPKACDHVFKRRSQTNLDIDIFEKYIKDFSKYKIVSIAMNTACDFPGQHWVSIFIDFRQPEIKLDFFDSLAKHNKKIDVFYEKIKKYYLETENRNVTLNRTKTKIQLDGNECGIYTIYFIVKRILDYTTFDKFMEHTQKDGVNDEFMLKKCREYFFRKYKTEDP